MNNPANPSKDRQSLTIRVPLVLRKRGGRKLVVGVEGAGLAPRRARVDTAIVKALARAHRWKQLMESGRYGSLTELAAAEGINQSYVCRVLRLALLAPDIVEAILDGQQPYGLQLDILLKPLPTEWVKQRDLLKL